MAANEQTSAERLDSWKTIADYLGRDVRTARRWERERQLPVHRVPGGGRTAVFAYPSEIDQWLRQDSAPDRADPGGSAPIPAPAPAPVAPSRRWRWSIVAALAVIAAVAAMWWGPPETRAADVATLIASQTQVVASDHAGRAVWAFRFPGRGDEVASDPAAVGLTGGGALVGADRFTSGIFGTTTGGRLWRLSDRGAIEWQHDVDASAVTYGVEEFRSPWILREWAEHPRNEGRQVALAWHHEVWWPSFVEVIDQVRASQFRFDNPGWIYSARWANGEGTHLAISGVNNPHDAGMAALLDVTAGASQAPDSGQSGLQCAACGAGRPVRYVILPRSEVNRALAGQINQATADVHDGRIVVRTAESVTGGDLSWGGAEVVYEFDLALQLQRATFGDRYWEVHARLEQQGRLTHSRATCPDRLGPPPIRAWTTAGGWVETRSVR